MLLDLLTIISRTSFDAPLKGPGTEAVEAIKVYVLTLSGYFEQSI